MGRWHFVEGVALADCALELEGDDLDDVFETGAAGLHRADGGPGYGSGHALPDRRARGGGDRLAPLRLAVGAHLPEGPRLPGLHARCHVRVLGDGPWHLTARLEGGLIEPGRTALGADPKAVTFHQFSLERAGTGWRARVVVDI